MNDSSAEQQAQNAADEPTSQNTDSQPDEGNALEQNPESVPADAVASDGDEPKKGEPDPALARLAFENRELKRQMAERERREQEARMQTLKADLDNPKTLADFDNDQTQYGRYLASLGPKSMELREMQQQAQQAVPATVDFDGWTERQSEFAETQPDFFETVYRKDLPITQDVANQMYELENGPAVAYHLAKNPEKLASIASLPPHALPSAMRVLSKQLSSGNTSKANVSSAPTPIDSDLGGGDVGTTKPVSASSAESDSLSTSEWVKRRNQELAKRRKR